MCVLSLHFIHVEHLTDFTNPSIVVGLLERAYRPREGAKGDQLQGIGFFIIGFVLFILMYVGRYIWFNSSYTGFHALVLC
jgi:hypothetical protein